MPPEPDTPTQETTEEAMKSEHLEAICKTLLWMTAIIVVVGGCYANERDERRMEHELKMSTNQSRTFYVTNTVYVAKP